MELISREECKDLMIFKYNDDTTFALDKALLTIDQVRTIESRPKGEWINDKGELRCPFCNHINQDQYFIGNYCPNCGADMRGDTE